MTEGNAYLGRKIVTALMMFILMAGIAAGTGLYSDNGHIAASVGGLVPIDGSSYDVGAAVSRSVFGAAVFIAAVFFLGFGTVFQPLAAVVVLFRGIGTGALLSHLYALAVNGVRGAAALLAVSVCEAAVGSFILAVAAAEAVLFSGQCARVMFFSGGAVIRPMPDVRLYLARFAVFAVGAVLCSGVCGVAHAAVAVYLL